MSSEQLRRVASERPYLLVAGLWLPVVVAAWVALVPSWISGGTLGWTTACGLTLTAIVVGALRSGRATRSVAHVLYEAEHGGRP